MGKGSARFLNISLAIVSLFCVLVFIGQSVCMNMMGGNAVRQLGVFYMSGIAEQVSAHFGTTIELRLSQVESIVNSVPPARTGGGTSMQIELSHSARSAGFEYLAFYSDDGNFHMIYGSQVKPDAPEVLRKSVRGGKNNVCAGTDAGGTPVVLVGVPAMYPMEDGSTSAALVAGLPTSYLSNTLASNIKGSIIKYSIIRNDGSYILHNDPAIEETNYFDRVAGIYEPYGGKNPEEYASELRAAMEANTDYTSEVLVAGEKWNIYCTQLPNSQWNLLLKISRNTLDETVDTLQRQWSHLTMGGCGLIIFALLVVFAGYLRLTRMQMKALEDARKTAEQAQLAAERSNRAKNEFLSNMSHDIRTPMNGIMGMTSIAIGNLDDPPRVKSCLKKIHVSSRHLLGLITDMLDMSKIESGKLVLNIEPVSLRDIMQNIAIVIQPQVQEKSQSFAIYPHNIYHENVCADRVRLGQILLNMIGNAVKYTPEGGVIRAELYEEPSPKGDGFIRSHLHISDNGIGISPAFQGRIFEAFAREDNARVDKQAGAGMGLAITKYIVDAMGGTISVESEQGKGSHFHVTLDMELTARQEKDLTLPDQNVLVVDDDADARRLAVEALESIGLHGFEADGIESALRLIRDRTGSDRAVQLVLLDHDACGADKGWNAGDFGLPVILMTDGEWDEPVPEAVGEAVGAALPKPLFRSGLYYGLRPFFETEPAGSGEGKTAGIAGRRILMAEDNELNWEIADNILSEYGLVMEWAENGKICVDKFAGAGAGWYDAVLMDLRMPVMNGFEAARAIRSLDRDDAGTVPIIAVSADAFQDDIQKCLDCGMNAHTGKPLDVERILFLLGKFWGLDGSAEEVE